MKNGRSLVDLAHELERQLATKRDMIVPTGLMHHETASDGTTSIRVETPDGLRTFRTTELFRRQVADKLKIPFAYFERMRTEQAGLLDRNVDTWLHHEPELRMVRTLDGQARAFLSDRYRRLDNYDLCDHVLPMLQQLPGVFCAGEMLDWEAPTGGYLLSGCLATGRAAGSGALSYLRGQ